MINDVVWAALIAFPAGVSVGIIWGHVATVKRFRAIYEENLQLKGLREDSERWDGMAAMLECDPAELRAEVDKQIELEKHRGGNDDNA